MIPPFTKLRGVGADLLDDTISAFTAEDWAVIDRYYLEPLGHIVMNYLDPLGPNDDVDSVVLLCTLYRHSTARTPEV